MASGARSPRCWPGKARTWRSATSMPPGSRGRPAPSPPRAARRSRSSATSPKKGPRPGSSTPRWSASAGIDILVNNVGGSRNAKIWEMKADDWDFVLRLNLRSTFLCTRAAVPHMMRRRYGRIVCMSSGAREGTPWTAYYQGGSAYSAAKAGVHGFVRDVALELAEHGINVNAVAPGPIDTERFGPGLRHMNETVEYSPNHMTPLRRLGEPIEVAHAVLFLASEEASYITGHTLAVTGGR